MFVPYFKQQLNLLPNPYFKQQLNLLPNPVNRVQIQNILKIYFINLQYTQHKHTHTHTNTHTQTHTLHICNVKFSNM